MIKRSVIVHYHIFKNAGTSVDHLLRKNFGERWGSFDGDSPGHIITTNELEAVIESSPDQVAFSSHQIVPPLPQVDADIYPIVFLRDPIDRIKSAYLFEWKKQLRLEEPKGTLKEFVEQKFQYVRKSSVEEFQTIRLSNSEAGAFHQRDISDEDMLGAACDFLSSLEFVGIVDQFDRSMQLLTNYLSQAFADFEYTPVKANVLQDITVDQSEKRQRIREEIGDELFEMIVERNQLDEQLYQHAKSCKAQL
ncbi:MAG: sulfotransferase family 2 domain-containing protein [Pseudomonadota bacterium]